MTTEQAIMYLAIGFMIIIGIWLTALTYLVLKRHKVQLEKEERVSERFEEESHVKEESEIETPSEDEEPETQDEESESKEEESSEEEKSE